MGQQTYGEMTGSAVAIVMREIVRRMMQAIRTRFLLAQAETKITSYKSEADVVTEADRAAQIIAVRSLRECFPGFGVVAEEDELRIPCTLEGMQAYFTLDPLDGTKAFTRRDSSGVGSMLALVKDDRVICAYVGQVMTDEIYGFRPDSNKVHRITPMSGHQELIIEQDRPLGEQYVLLRDHPEHYTPIAQNMVRPRDKRGLFKNVEIRGGSIGVAMAQLWNGGAGAQILRPGFQTPWDSAPVLGISQQLGFRFFLICGNGVLKPWTYKPQTEVFRTEHELLIVHESRLTELTAYGLTLTNEHFSATP